MKTNQIMTRQMGQFKVEQRTKDGYFNATALLKQWNLNAQNFGDLKRKEIDNYLNNKATKEFIEAIVKEEELHTEIPYVTSRGKYNGGTWMHPIMFMDFAMWLNPSFKVKVIKFAYDQMIKYRNDAGDAYLALSVAISKIVPKAFIAKAMKKISEAINWVVFNAHEKMIRNKEGEETKMRELFELERKLADLINDGFIRDFDSAVNYLRRKYTERNYPTVFR